MKNSHELLSRGCSGSALSTQGYFPLLRLREFRTWNHKTATRQQTLFKRLRVTADCPVRYSEQGQLADGRQLHNFVGSLENCGHEYLHLPTSC
jgi:hypothetical protein